MRRLARIDLISVPWKAHTAFLPPTAAAQRWAVRWPLMFCNAQRRSGHNPDPVSGQGGIPTTNLKLLPELCTPVTTIVGLPTTTTNVGRH
jgi:hypothetical protein